MLSLNLVISLFGRLTFIDLCWLCGIIGDQSSWYSSLFIVSDSGFVMWLSAIRSCIFYLSSKLHISQKEAGFIVTAVIITNHTIFSIILSISHHISHIYYFRLEPIDRKSSHTTSMRDCLEGIRAGLTSLCPSLLLLWNLLSSLFSSSLLSSWFNFFFFS